MRDRALTLLGAPSSAGAYAPGQEKAPGAFRRHGLLEALGQAGVRARDQGDVDGFRWRPDPQRPQAANLPEVQRVAEAVAERVAEALQRGDDVLVLGGDCTVELGTVAGALRTGSSVGLVYVDLDADLQVPATSDGALDWTGVAHLLDLPGASSELAGLGPRRPMLEPEHVLFFAVHNVTEREQAVMRERGMQPIGLAEVRADPQRAARRAVAWAERYEKLLVHLDVDVLSFLDFPLAENVRRCDGLRLDELEAALAVLLGSPRWRALTVTEVNPDHAPDEASTFRLLLELLCRVLSPLT